jgi:hypothetical protein
VYQKFDIMATTKTSRYKRNLEKLNQCAEGGKLMWIVDPKCTDLYSDSGMQELTHECVTWINNQRDTLCLVNPRPSLVPMGRNPQCCFVLAWKLSSKVESLAMSDFDLIVLPDHMTMAGILKMDEAKSCLSLLSTSTGCTFLPGLQEYFEIADKFAVHSRLKWKLPHEMNVKIGSDETSVYITKLPSIPIINHVNINVTPGMVQNLKDKLNELIAEENELLNLIDKQEKHGYER